MRKILIFIVITIFILLISFTVYGIFIKTMKKENNEKSISRLPSFSFITLEGNSFDSRTIFEGPVLIVRFHPECDHCSYEISQIMKSKIHESCGKILFVTSAEMNDVVRFMSQFETSEKGGVITLLDTSSVFNNIFGKDVIPSNYIYNKRLELVKALYGEYKTETILKYLNANE